MCNKIILEGSLNAYNVTSPSTARQVKDTAAVMRESVDFSDFLKSALDSEDDKERKLVY